MTPSPSCGCQIHVVFHDDHINKPTVMDQWIEQCKTHAQGFQMKALLQDVDRFGADDSRLRDKMRKLLSEVVPQKGRVSDDEIK